MKNFRAPIIFTLMLLPVTALPQAYIGGTVGLSDAGSDWDKGTSYSALGGYRFGDYFALEAGYINYGEADDNLPPIWTLKGDALDAAALAILPITERFELYAKVGFSSWDVELFEQGFGKIAELDGEDVNYGVGVAFNFTENFSMSAGYQQYKFEAGGEDDEIDNIYLGAKLYFGTRSTKATPSQSTASQPYAAPASQYAVTSGLQLKAVNEADKGNCDFIETLTRGAGGPGEPSAHLDRAMAGALTDAANAGANSYFIVETSATDSGATVVLEALNCQ